MISRVMKRVFVLMMVALMSAVMVNAPDNLDTSDLVDVFASNGSRIIRYRETSTGLRIVMEPARKTERVLAQK